LRQLVSGFELALGFGFGFDPHDAAFDADGQVFAGDAGQIERHGPGFIVLFHFQAAVMSPKKVSLTKRSKLRSKERNAGKAARVRTTGAKNMMNSLHEKRVRTAVLFRPVPYTARLSL